MKLLVLALCASCASARTELRGQTPRDRMAAIASDYWELMLASAPRDATALGDHRYDADLESEHPVAVQAVRAQKRALLERIQALSGAALSDAERLNRDVLAHMIMSELAPEEACHYERWRLDHLGGIGVQLADLQSTHLPISIASADALIARYRQVPRLVAEHIAGLRRGLILDETAPAHIAKRVVAQLDGLLAQEPTPFVPATTVPARKEALRAVVKAHVLPALRAYRSVVADEILPVARQSVGISALPYGAACYAAEITRFTGLQLSPAEIHAVGLQEVARIRTAMDLVALRIVKQKASKTTLKDALRALDADPKQHPKSRQELLAAAEAILRRAQAALPKAFGRLPQGAIAMKAIETFAEKESPAAYYRPAPDDGAMPAYYLLNTYAPESRLLYEQEALAFHESVPGHHLQIALAHEMRGEPAFRRFVGQTAFVEGWALYAEALAEELGLYSSDATKLGRLGAELWRARRLVVDTGMHALGWSREAAIAFMREGSTQPEIEIVNEIDRYIAWPAQALAYKLGERAIWQMRHDGERRLGKRFDLRAFHDAFLGGGALPLAIMHKRMDAWVSAQEE